MGFLSRLFNRQQPPAKRQPFNAPISGAAVGPGLDEEVAMWDTIHGDPPTCPDCEATDSMLEGPRGGMALNIRCSSCGQTFWVTHMRELGAKRL